MERYPKNLKRAVLAVVAVCLIGAAVAVGLRWHAARVRQALERSRERLAREIETPAFRYYRQLAERDAVAEGTAWPALHDPGSVPLSEANGLPLPEASWVILETLEKRIDPPEETEDSSAEWEYLEVLKIGYESLCDWTPEEQQRVEAFMAEREDLLTPLRTLIERGGPVPLPRWRTEDRELCGYSCRLRDAGRFLALEAKRRAAAGSEEAAFEILADVMTLGERGEPAPSPSFIRWGAYSQAIGAIEAITDRREVDPELVLRFAESLKGAHGRSAFADSIPGWIYTGLKGLEALDRGQVSYYFYTPWQRLLMLLYDEPAGSPWRIRDEVTLIDWGLHYASIANKPYYEAYPSFWDVEALPDSLIVSSSTLWCMQREFSSQAGHEALLDLARLGLLIELHQRANGSLPASLDAVAPVLGEPVPVDPFSGEPYRYLPDGDTFLLYSVGRNLQDDGGFHDFGFGDIVWRGRVDEELAEMRRKAMSEFFGNEFGVDLTEDSE